MRIFGGMKERLNLTIDRALLEAMKVYAASKQMSVSELVETYFRSVTKPVHRKNILDLVDELGEPDLVGQQEPSKVYAPAATQEELPPGRTEKSFAQLEAELIAWATQPGPMTNAKKRKHGF